ncbi:DUF418 domain-containing protein [Pseudogracilibacillus sp. ICA-222130]|uniref:DUF418 domain-containing protein n=1 Tax=Pseudogracilibacillus sp. ICA-222130 TaxID=3134655 RepID=UPI0030BFDEF7
MKNYLSESSPISSNERIVSLDIIRGFALFGILLVNMPLFQTPKLVEELYMISPELSGIDQFARMMLDVFVETKFFAIFSILFGIGFYIFMQRAEEKSTFYYRLYSRRLIALGVFGFLHLVFFWYGDILLRYALAGFFLIFFYKRKEKTILIWILSFVCLLFGLLTFSFFAPTEEMEQQITNLQMEGAPKVAEAIDIYNNGSYTEWLSYRFTEEVIPVLINMPFSIITPLFYFLIGLYIAKKGILTDFHTHKQFITRVWLISLLVSIPLSVGIIILHLNVIDVGVLNDQILEVLLLASGLSLSFFYIATILLLLEKEKWKRILHPLHYVGKMALTNYIMQTFIGVGIFTGLGLFGELHLWLGIVISFLVFPLQILFSFLWLQHFRFGPLEWIWRSITYGQFQSIRINKS